jgi:hypothetical protein
LVEMMVWSKKVIETAQIIAARTRFLDRRAAVLG